MRTIDCETGYDSHWIPNNRDVFVFEEETSLQLCINLIESIMKGESDERQQKAITGI